MAINCVVEPNHKLLLFFSLRCHLKKSTLLPTRHELFVTQNLVLIHNNTMIPKTNPLNKGIIMGTSWQKWYNVFHSFHYKKYHTTFYLITYQYCIIISYCYCIKYHHSQLCTDSNAAQAPIYWQFIIIFKSKVCSSPEGNNLYFLCNNCL